MCSRFSVRPGDLRSITDVLTEGLPQLSVAVVGDVMLDIHAWCTVERISPEAPVPVARLERQVHSPGGASNVARNLASLGASVALFGVVGCDFEAQLLRRSLEEKGVKCGGLLEDQDHQTITKTRIIGNHQQLVRIDREGATRPAPATLQQMVQRFARVVRSFDVVILSDYLKGTLTSSVARRCTETARAAGVPVFVDPKGRDYFKYRGATALTPNRRELREATGTKGHDMASLVEAARLVRRWTDADHVVVTLSERGLLYVREDDFLHVPTDAREVFDVCGAGDTVIACLAAGYALGVQPLPSLHLANLAASVVVSRPGTAAVSLEDLLGALADSVSPARRFSTPVAQLVRCAEAWRREGGTIVLVSGTFPCLDNRRLRFLKKAAKLGDHLVVVITPDGETGSGEQGRLGCNEAARLVASLRWVDAVTVLDSHTLADLVSRLMPHVVVRPLDPEAARAWPTELMEQLGTRILSPRAVLR